MPAGRLMIMFRLSKHRNELTGPNLGRFQRWPMTGFSSYMAIIQPFPAYVGLISCLLIVFVLNSVSMFNHVQIPFKALTIYLGVRISPLQTNLNPPQKKLKHENADHNSMT